MMPDPRQNPQHSTWYLLPVDLLEPLNSADKGKVVQLILNTPNSSKTIQHRGVRLKGAGCGKRKLLIWTA